jgi:hypothetical protein
MLARILLSVILPCLGGPEASGSRVDGRPSPAPPDGGSIEWRRPGYSARLSAAGVRVQVPGAERALGLRTSRFARGEHEVALRVPDLGTSGQRVQLDHGSLVEWFVEHPLGLEQGWTIAARPEGEGELRIGVELEGGFELRVDGTGRSGTLVSGATELDYAGLHAFDASGRALPAWLRADEHGFVVEVGDAGARYPITVDPVLAWRVQGTQAGEKLGTSVAGAGDVNGDGYDDILYSSPFRSNGEASEGRVALHLGSPLGPSAMASWTEEGNQAGAQFGFDVAGAGDVNGDGYDDVIVGARLYSNVESGEGVAFVYHGSASGLASTPATILEADQAGAAFGTSVAGAGDVNDDTYDDVIVGAPNYSNGQPDEGRAFVYLGSSGGLSTTPVWVAEVGQIGALLGNTVASAGDVDDDGFDDVLVTALEYSNGQANEGAAFLYLGPLSGVDTTPDWSFETNQVDARVTDAVCAGHLNGDARADVLVGSQYFDGPLADEGRVFLFLPTGAGVPLVPDWTAEGDQDGALFGSIASAGDHDTDGFDDFLVGAYRWNQSHGDEGDGKAYM